eukprot:6045189-Amphidinium_carterae.1
MKPCRFRPPSQSAHASSSCKDNLIIDLMLLEPCPARSLHSGPGFSFVQTQHYVKPATRTTCIGHTVLRYVPSQYTRK